MRTDVFALPGELKVGCHSTEVTAEENKKQQWRRILGAKVSAK